MGGGGWWRGDQEPQGLLCVPDLGLVMPGPGLEQAPSPFSRVTLDVLLSLSVPQFP